MSYTFTGGSHFTVDVFDMRAKYPGLNDGKIESGVLAFVYTAGTKTLATLYKDEKLTTLANPITRTQFATDKGLKFFVNAGSVDIVLCHSDGTVSKHDGVVEADHNLFMNRSGSQKCLVVPFGASDATEVDTGIDLPRWVHIQDVAIEVVTTDATETLDVGLLSSETSGDADGLLALISVGTSGYVKPYAYTTGSNETYVSTAKYGTLMGPVVVGTDVDKDNGAAHGYGHVINASTAVSLSYTGSTGSDTAAGYIYVKFSHLR